MLQHLVDYLEKLLSNEALPPNSQDYFLTIQDLLDEKLVIRKDGKLEITPKGKAALEEHKQTLQEKRQLLKISKASLVWAIIAAAIGFIGIIVSILLSLLL